MPRDLCLVFGIENVNCAGDMAYEGDFGTENAVKVRYYIDIISALKFALSEFSLLDLKLCCKRVISNGFAFNSAIIVQMYVF